VTAVVPAVRPGAPALGRAAAGLAGASAVVHLLQVGAGSLGALVMAAMALACLPCAWHLWRAPTPSVWGLTAAIDGGMLLLHATLVAQHPAHHEGAVAGGLMWPGLVLIAAQLALAGVAALRSWQPAQRAAASSVLVGPRSRGYRPLSAGQRGARSGHRPSRRTPWPSTRLPSRTPSTPTRGWPTAR
jgi:hypothetical protein